MINGSKIQSPVTVTDVRTILESSSTNVGTLCRSSNINKYSACKPIDREITTGVDITDLLMSKSVAKLCRFGMQPKYISNIYYGLDNLSDNIWKLWQPPTKKFRLGDFTDYNHNAVPYIKNIAFHNSLINEGSEGYDKPVVIVNSLDVYTVTGHYVCDITVDNSAEIKIQDYINTNSEDFGEMYWTMFFISLSGIYIDFVLDLNKSNTYNLNHNTTRITLLYLTTTEDFIDRFYFEGNMIRAYVCLAPKITSIDNLPATRVSPMMYSDGPIFYKDIDGYVEYGSSLLPKPSRQNKGHFTNNNYITVWELDVYKDSNGTYYIRASLNGYPEFVVTDAEDASSVLILGIIANFNGFHFVDPLYTHPSGAFELARVAMPGPDLNGNYTCHFMDPTETPVYNPIDDSPGLYAYIPLVGYYAGDTVEVQLACSCRIVEHSSMYSSVVLHSDGEPYSELDFLGGVATPFQTFTINIPNI